MNKLKKVFVLVLIVAVVSLGLTGCGKKSEHPSGDHPSKKTSTEEQPASEHPSKEDSTEEHPAEEQSPKESSTKEHPSGEHPK